MGTITNWIFTLIFEGLKGSSAEFTWKGISMGSALHWAQVLTPIALSLLGLAFLGWSLWLKTVQKDWGERVDEGFLSTDRILQAIKDDVHDIKRRIDIHDERHNKLKIETVTSTTELKVRLNTLEKLMNAVETSLKSAKTVDY